MNLPYVSGPEAFTNAHLHYGSPEALLRFASKAIEPTKTAESGIGPDPTIDDEIRALNAFLAANDLELDGVAIQGIFEQNNLRGGREHKVAFIEAAQRVVKIVNARKLATQSLFDYLTDLELANYLFGDDIELAGFYTSDADFHVVITQPFIQGVHPDWNTLVAGLDALGLRHESPASKTSSFVVCADGVGELNVIDLHENNVIQGSHNGDMVPIDAHFFFDSPPHERISMLKVLGFAAE